MPESTRDKLKRWHDQADNDLDRFLENARRMSITYKEEGDERHEPIAAMVDKIAIQIIKIQEAWREFGDKIV